MSKILTISIPTYNRPGRIKTLVSDLIDADLLEFIEVNVHDNSDIDIQNLNKLSCINVNYFPNLSNLGYGGNVRKCIEKATGDYLFIISDDDGYDFSKIVTILKLLSENKCGALALTCVLSTDATQKFNTLLNPSKLESMTLGEILDSTDVVTPFNLLPSVIVETTLMKRGMLLFPTRDNGYMHAMLFLMGAAPETKVMFDRSEFIVTYNVPEKIQFNVYSLLKSKEDITDILRKNFNVNRSSGLEVLEISKWCFMSNIGVNKAQYGFRQVLYFTYKSLMVLKLSPIFFLWLGLLPSVLKNQLYKLYLRLKSARIISRDIE